MKWSRVFDVGTGICLGLGFLYLRDNSIQALGYLLGAVTFSVYSLKFYLVRLNK
jgi:hypothetical protein